MALLLVVPPPPPLFDVVLIVAPDVLLVFALWLDDKFSVPFPPRLLKLPLPERPTEGPPDVLGL